MSKNIFIWVFCILLSISAIRVLVNYQNYPSNLLPDSNELVYDDDGNRISFYDYFQRRYEFNKDTLSFRGFLEILSSFEHDEFRTIDNIIQASKELSTMLRAFKDMEEPENPFLNLLLTIYYLISFFIFVVYQVILAIIPLILDIFDMILAVFKLVFSLIGMFFGG